MTTLVEPPVREPVAGIRTLELEITGTCQLRCTHCLSESSPQATHGTMTPEDWRTVIIDAAALAIPKVQLIGGEPTVHPNWRQFAELALSLGLRVQVYSNLYRVQPTWWELFERQGVTLGTSYYSDDPAEHDRITRKPGSFVRTRANIREAVQRGISVQAGIVDILPGQRVEQARTELEAIGVQRIVVDHVRAVGRAALPGRKPVPEDLCGKCTRGRAAVLPNGDLAGCVLSRFMPSGNVKQRRLADLLSGSDWAALAARIPQQVRNACPPDDSGDCDPANTEACDPAYG
jgi:MoaA/NifB/PqqE/SkfB family radical SAM enzyme